MAGYWSIIVPEATTNLVSNPSFETGSTGWTAAAGAGGTVTPTRAAAAARRGAYGTQLVITYGSAVNRYILGANGGAGAFAATAGNSYTASIDFYSAAIGSAAVTFYMSWFTVVPAFISNSATVSITTSGSWTRASITATAPATTALGALVVSVDTAGITCYIDGAQVEEKAYATTYADGSMGAGYTWAGSAHASTSSRTAQARDGGRVYNLDSYGAYVIQSPGLGMPPFRINSLDQPFQAGALFQGRKTLTRSLSIVADVIGSSRANLHSLRAALIDAIKPDLTADEQPVTFRYAGASTDNELEICAYYDSGLEYGIPDGFSEMPSIRFVAYDPMWYDQGNTAAALDVIDSGATTDSAASVMARIDGQWGVLGDAGLNAIIRDVVEGPNGTKYFAGNFTNASSDANADFIAAYSGGVFSNIGAADTDVYCLEMGSDGRLYAGGNMTTLGGVTVNYFGVYSSTGWESPVASSDLDASVNDLLAVPGGSIWLGGSFTGVAGSTSGAYITSYVLETDSWSNIGPADNVVSALFLSKDKRKVYASGSYANIGGVAAASGLAEYDLQTATWTAITTGFTVGTSTISPVTGNLIAIASTSDRTTYEYNGSVWTQIGTITTEAGGGSTYVEVDANGDVYVYGEFQCYGNQYPRNAYPNISIWNGAYWRWPYVLPPVTLGTAVSEIIVDNVGDMFITYANTGTGAWPGNTTVTNAGSAITYPVMEFYSAYTTAGRLFYIENATTGAILHLNYSLSDEETITIDCRPGHRGITSNIYGNIIHILQRGSDLAQFWLTPGANVIKTYVYGSNTPATDGVIRWRNTYWSGDR